MDGFTDKLASGFVSWGVAAVMGIVTAAIFGYCASIYGDLLASWLEYPLPFGLFCLGVAFFGFLLGWLTRSAVNEKRKNAAAKRIESQERIIEDLESDIGKMRSHISELEAMLTNGELTTIEQAEKALAAVLEKDRNDPSHLWRGIGKPLDRRK